MTQNLHSHQLSRSFDANFSATHDVGDLILLRTSGFKGTEHPDTIMASVTANSNDANVSQPPRLT